LDGIKDCPHTSDVLGIRIFAQAPQRLLAQSSEEVAFEAVAAGDIRIDDEGRVWRTSTGRRAEHAHPRGYLSVWIFRPRKVQMLAHRLVYLHLVGHIPDGMTINHIDGDKQNNRPSNLELATAKQQAVHARDVLGHHLGEKNGRAKLSAESVERLRAMHAEGVRFAELGRHFGVSNVSARAAALGKTWQTTG
jgi:hypothetical protein